MKQGDSDGHTLVTEVFIATAQPAPRLSRYQGMNHVGSMTGFFIYKLSPFEQDFFNTPDLSLKY